MDVDDIVGAFTQELQKACTKHIVPLENVTKSHILHFWDHTWFLQGQVPPNDAFIEVDGDKYSITDYELFGAKYPDKNVRLQHIIAYKKLLFPIFSDGVWDSKSEYDSIEDNGGISTKKKVVSINNDFIWMELEKTSV